MGRHAHRIAHEIVERNRGTELLALVGFALVATCSLDASRRCSSRSPTESGPVALDITLYRDDLSGTLWPSALVRRTDIPFSIATRKSSGRRCFVHRSTIRAALDALIDFGRPKEIQLVVLVDRGPSASSRSKPTMWKERSDIDEGNVHVRLSENDGTDEVSVSAEQG